MMHICLISVTIVIMMQAATASKMIIGCTPEIIILTCICSFYDVSYDVYDHCDDCDYDASSSCQKYDQDDMVT